MAEYIVGPILGKVIDACFEYVQDLSSMKDNLERLRENQHNINDVVSVACQAQIIDQDPALKKWIWQLRDAIDEADDLLDDFDYQKHEEQLATNQEETKVHSLWNFLSNPTKKFRASYERAFKINHNLKRLEEAMQKLDRVSAKVGTFLHLLESRKQEQQVELHKTRETGSLPRNDLIGRGKVKELVIEWLRKPSNKEHQTHVTTTALYYNISLLSIVGHGGMGKTTLVQHVYADEMTKEFDLKMWVCVSDSFDASKVIKDMLECLENERPSSLHALQERLKSKVMSRKFLLVLDDLWDKEEGNILCYKWENVLAPLAYGGLGSKILITTRTDSVASMIAKVITKKKEALILEGLREDECLQLLTTYAFANVENPDGHKKLKSIAGELVKKLFGSPLAAKVMGGVLNSSLDERHWRNVLNSNLGHNDIFPILKLSYIFLPQHLRSCFSFCSIFEQDHIFVKDELVQMWIALGFIQASHIQGETYEDIGGSYFDVLINKSFFDKVSTEKYKMHDLLHELAQSISTQEIFRFVGDEKLLLGIPETIRHLYVKTSNPEVLKKMGRFKNLRTLLITCHNQNFVDALNEMLKVTKSIRLLHINNHMQEMIPENIGYLHHLRYLRFLVSNNKPLPRSIVSLYHLQFLSTTGDCSDDFFPRDMNNLSNLRYFSGWWLNIPGIGKLKLLQELYGFYVKNENDYRIGELEHMNDLRILGINNLENVRDGQEAFNAKLCDKKKLIFLSLQWAVVHNTADPDLDENVLDNLQPHNYLKRLEIKRYMGARSANWMNDDHVLNNLDEIHLIECLEWEILPPFGQLPFLNFFVLRNMPKVKRLENKFHGNDMCCVFPSLERLSIVDLEGLVDWFDASVVDGLFPCLTTLHLCNCPNLQELPYLPPKLESLEINNIGWKTLNCCTISKSIPLRILQVRNCENMTSIFLAGAMGKLKELTFENLPSLQSLPSLLRVISSLEILKIEGLSQLRELPDLPPSLKNLTFKNLPLLHSLPSSLKNIFALEILELKMLPELRELPDLPPSLRNLIINECDPELMKRHKNFSSSI